MNLLINISKYHIILLSVEPSTLHQEINKAVDWFSSLDLPSFNINSLIFVICFTTMFVGIVGGKVKFGPLEIESKGIGEFIKQISEAINNYWDARVC